MTVSTPLMPHGLDALGLLLDRVAERQRADFGQLDSEAKADGSLITACDRWSDAALVEGLAQLYPGEGVLSEEGSQRVPSTDAFWVVDPLDGTTNFAAGIPYWAISIARFERGVPVLAVLDVPPLRQRIVAVRGGGAWR
jgi:myo-inositol-1(or 4)-monophosphatase